MANTLGFAGERLDLLIRQGADLGPYFVQMKNADGSFVNLTGCSIYGVVKKNPKSAAIAATIYVDISEPLSGKYSFFIPHNETALISAGSTVNEPASQYYWELELTDSNGRVVPLYQGSAKVFRELTR